jgi:hypothetical protein
MQHPFGFEPADRFTADTSLEAGRVQVAIYQRMTPEQRLMKAFDLTECVRELAAAGVRSRHPEYTDRQVKFAVIRLVLGDELFRTVYPHEDVAV